MAGFPSNVYPLAHEIFSQYWEQASRDLIDAEAIAERVIRLADDDPSRIFNSSDLSKDDYGILHGIIYTRAATLSKPIIGWTYLIASVSLCQDMDAEENRDLILSQAWSCWRTSAAAAKAAEERYQEQIEEYEDKVMPQRNWRPHDLLEGGLIWNVDGDTVLEVHPIRMQD